MVFKSHVKQRYYFTELKTSPDYATIILGSWFLFANIYMGYDFYGLFYSILHIMWVGIIIVPCWNSFIVALLIYVVIELNLINYKLALLTW